ncbi:MAG: hypothetical protein ACLRQF_09365 [Thomasclavelia ramosa]
MNYPQAFQDLVDCFKRLPGIGGKSAERLHIMFYQWIKICR